MRVAAAATVVTASLIAVLSAGCSGKATVKPDGAAPSWRPRIDS
jgi:hypothetical protein